MGILDSIPYADDLAREREGKPIRKPALGEKITDHRKKTAETKAHEQKQMQAALVRDERKCRVPRCEFASKKLPIDACHLRHRGIGGNPSGDRTTRETIIALCRTHHGRYDRAEMDIIPQTPAKFDGPCDYANRNGEVFASERVIGVSTERSAR